MRHFTVLTMFAIGALLAGCNQKSSQAASDAPALKADSSATVAEPQNPPATFHPNKGSKNTASAAGNYAIQISVFKIKKQAQALVEKLTSEGFEAYVAEVESPTSDLSGDYYRVRIGGFATRTEATEFAEQKLKPKGFDFWVDAKSNDNAGASPSSYRSPAVKSQVVPSRPAYQPSAIYHPPVRAAVKEAAPSSKHVGLDVPAPVAPAPAAPAPQREFPATEPAAPSPGDSMRSPFSTDEAPSESAPEEPAPAPLAPYKGDSSGVHSRRVLPTW